MTRARVTEAVLAAAGTLAAVWPLTTLLEGGVWLWHVIGLVLMVTAAGVVLRAVGATRSVVLVGQVVLLLAVVTAGYLEHTIHLDVVAAQVADLVGDAHSTIVGSAPPAPVTPGLDFVLSLVVPVLAIATDYLAVTIRNPAASGIPLLGVFMLSASNQAAGLNPLYFVLVAVVWLSMLAHGTSRTMRGWASTLARPSTPTRFENLFSRHASVARLLGVGTLALALVIPAVLPHRSPVMLGGGLGQGSSGGGSGSSAMFGSEEDIARDLLDQGSGVVLTFRTNDPSPPPLRVLTTADYRSGRWDLHPDRTRVTNGSERTRMGDQGRSDDAPTSTYRMQVRRNTLRAPQLAAPFPTTAADLRGTPWQYEPATGRILPKRHARSYAVTYQHLKDDARPFGSSDGPTPGGAYLELPEASMARVTKLARSIGGATPFRKAIAIQDYLRDGSFTYSLQLADRRKGPDGKDLDPLSNFLVTKKGYCIQFATAMVMLARADGIPARFAVGFLPGERQTDDSYRIIRSDAHAWPELWFPGLGWTRFEPTPGERSGSAPLYAIVTQPGIGSEPQNTIEPRTQTSQPAAPVPAPEPKKHAAPAPTSSAWPTVGWIALVLALLGAALLLLPGIARYGRGRMLRTAQHSTSPVEAEWTVLRSRLDDLGIPPPHGRSPRAEEDYYRRYLDLSPGTDDDALHTAVRTVESARYAAPGAQATATIREASAHIVQNARAKATLGTRLSALLWPRTGRRAITAVLRPLRRRRRRQSR